MRRRVSLLLLAAAIALAAVPLRAAGAAGPVATVQVLAVDAARAPVVEATVLVRDINGYGIAGLDASAFSIDLAETSIPGERIAVAPSDELPPAFSVALVADTSTLIGRDVDTLRTDARTLAGQILDAGGSLAIFLPRSAAGGPEQQLAVAPFGSDPQDTRRRVAGLDARPGQTDLYNAIVAAVHAAADDARQRGGPAYVLVLSDGIDRSSIVGRDMAGANEAARAAEERHVQIIALGYGSGLRQGQRMLAQIADRTGGQFLPYPDAAALQRVADGLQARAAGGLYTLRFSAALPQDGQEHPLRVHVRQPTGAAVGEARFLAPRAIDRRAAVRLELHADAGRYPEITLRLRPINRLQETVPNLTAGDLQLFVDGQPLTATLRLASEPLDPHDEAAVQSVAVVVDQHGADAATLRAAATRFLQAPDDVPSRIALFVPGIPGGEQPFSHDHNAQINRLNRLPPGAATGSLGPTLLQAIDAVARDAAAHARPAYVVLFGGDELPPAERAQAAARARDAGVTIHAVSAGPQPTRTQAALSGSTGGTALAAPDDTALVGLAQAVAANRASRYVATFRAPFPADGRARRLAVVVGAVRAEQQIVPFIDGPPVIGAPLSHAAQLGIFALVALALAACIAVPRIVQDRRLRCPTCGRVRRASWGRATCLFCEYAALHGSDTRSREAPLAALANQGEALLQSTPVPATPAMPPGLPPTGNSGLLPTEDHRASSRGSARGDEGAVPESPAADAPPITGMEPGAPPRHTDFWGPLPAEEIRANGDDAAAITGMEPGAPPRHTDFWGPLPAEEIRASGDDAVAITGMEPGAPPRHTDFWGPLPGDEPAAPAPAAARPPQPADAAEDEPTETQFWGPITLDSKG